MKASVIRTLWFYLKYFNLGAVHYECLFTHEWLSQTPFHTLFFIWRKSVICARCVVLVSLVSCWKDFSLKGCTLVFVFSSQMRASFFADLGHLWQLLADVYYWMWYCWCQLLDVMVVLSDVYCWLWCWLYYPEVHCWMCCCVCYLMITAGCDIDVIWCLLLVVMLFTWAALRFKYSGGVSWTYWLGHSEDGTFCSEQLMSILL